MHILHVRASDFYGGPERQLHFHAREALRSERVRVTVASFQEKGAAPEFLTRIGADGIDIHTFPVRSAYDPASLRLLRDYLRAHAVDVLCTHDYRSTTLGWIATAGLTTRWVAFSRGFTMTRAKIRLFQGLEKLVTRRADHVVAVSTAQKEKLQRLRIADHRITVARNAIDPTALVPEPPVDLRERFGLAPDTTVCVSGGRFSREKGQSTLIEAALRALERRADLRFILFGAGPDRDALLAGLEARGATDRILCPGFATDMLGCLKGADLLINPSLSEGLPNIVLEAMAMEIPVVATAVGGVPEILTHGETGWLIPPADPAALTEAILEVAADPQRRRARAIAARRFVEEHCTFGAQFAVLLDVYRRVTSG